MQHHYPTSLSLSLSRVAGFFEGCDLIHAHYGFPDVVATVRTFGSRFPILATVHGSDVNCFAMKPSLRPDIVSAFNALRTVICVSGSLASRLRDIGVEAEMEVIPNGIDTDRFIPGDRREACISLGLDPDRPRLLFIGNFLPVKGIEYLIRALPEVVRKHRECELVLVGATPGNANAKKYIELARDLGVEKAMTVMNRAPHDTIPVWMRASDVFVLPSLNEGFGIVAAEALACGVPVVATRCGGPEDIIRKGLGFLVPPRDAETLGHAIIRALGRDGVGSPEYLAASARERFSNRTVARRVLEVYRRTIENR